MRGWTRRRLLYLLSALGMASVTLGYGLASDLTSTSVAQSASLFSVSSGGVAAFPTPPAVAVTTVPSAVSACSSSAVGLGSGSTVALYLAASSGVTCTTGDFAIEFNFTSAATAAAGGYTFTAYTTYGPGPTSGSATGLVTVASTLSSSGNVDLYVDYGGPSPPSGGIADLSLVVG